METSICKNPEEAASLLREMVYFSFDIETSSLDYYTAELEGISFCDGNKVVYLDLLKISQDLFKDMLNVIRTAFINAKKIIAHNIVFDLKILKKFGVDVPEDTKLFCTLVADHLIDENREHGLKFLAQEVLDEEETVSYQEASKDKSSTKWYNYVCNDAKWTWKLHEIHLKELQEQNLFDLFFNIEMPFQRVLVDMMVNGILVDKDELTMTKIKLEKLIENLTIEMCEILKEPYEIQVSLLNESKIITKTNFNSSLQLSKILFERLGLPVIEKTPGGAPSVGKKTINDLGDKHEFVKILKDYKEAQKLLNSFFSPLVDFIDDDGRVRPNFRDTGTATGRLSCNSPNLQQLPKENKDLSIDTRRCFIATPGYKMIACDYSGQELRVLTQLTQSQNMIDTFNKGKDMHLSTANDFFNLNIPEEGLYDGTEEHDTYKKKFKAERNKAKIINFGMAYGKGAYGFSKDFGITEEEAQEILDRYFAALPKVKAAIDQAHGDVKTKGFVTSMAGRRRRFKAKEIGDYSFYPKKAFRQAFNFLIQGYSADMIRKAANSVRKKSLAHPEWDLRPLMTVHDEIVYEVKEQYVDEAASMIKEKFESADEFVIPIIADVDIGNNYSEAK